MRLAEGIERLLWVESCQSVIDWNRPQAAIESWSNGGAR